MKAFYFFPLLFVFCFASPTFPQEPAGAGKPEELHRDGERPKLMEALGLSPEQMKEFGRLNQERRPKMQAAQQRLRESLRALDMAIYADNVNDSEVGLRLREHQEAQAEIARLRFEGELAMRKLLTAEQLVRFRQFRRQFNATREKNQMERRMRREQDAPRFDRRRRGADRRIILPED